MIHIQLNKKFTRGRSKIPFYGVKLANCILPVASEETEAPDFDVSMYKITYTTETSHFHS